MDDSTEQKQILALVSDGGNRGAGRGGGCSGGGVMLVVVSGLESSGDDEGEMDMVTAEC